jgi:hypothetical protein
MVKVKCLYGTFKVDKCKLEIIDSMADSIIKTAFNGSMKLGPAGPSAGDPDMVIAKRMLKCFPNTGEILEHKYKPDPDVVY